MKKLLSISVLSVLVLIPSCSSSTTPKPPASPTIDSFTLSPTSIYQGATATLSWSVSNATSVQIDQGIGTVGLSGSKTVNPDRDTTYTLTATNSTGSKTATSTLSVKWNLSGNWTGTIQGRVTSQATFAISQTEGALTGTWTITHGSIKLEGSATGTVSGNTVTATLTGSSGYQATFSGTISNYGKQVDGSGTDSEGTWTFSLTKQ